MHKLLENAKKELKQIAENGLNSTNLDNAYKLADIAKNIVKLQEMEEGEGKMRSRYMDGRYEGRGGYHDGGCYDDWYGNYDDNIYGRRNLPNTRRMRTRDERYLGNDRWHEHLDRIMEDADGYEYGKGRYRDSGDSERMYDGLEKLMHSICTFIEATMDFAESPEEKDIIRKHIQKIKNI